MIAAMPALGADACGPAAGTPLSVVCSDTGNPYTDGINYHTTTGLTLEVATGVVVTRTPGASHIGIQLSGEGADPLTLTVNPGVVLNTSGDMAYSIQVHANAFSTSNVSIDSAADINYSYAGPVTPGVGAGGIIGRISNVASTASVSVTQRAGSTITIEGEEGLGLYALQRGLGAATVTAGGDIHVTGGGGYAASIYATNTNATGNLLIVQNAGSTLTTAGAEAAAVFILSLGRGAARAEISGSIETTGDVSDGVLIFPAHAGSAAEASAQLADTAEVTTHGDGSKGVWVYHQGLGASAVTSAGSIETFGANSHGIYTSSANAANTARHVVTLTDSGSVTTHGDGSVGIYVGHEGSGTVAVALGGTSRITTSGVLAHGIQADATGEGSVTVTQAEGTAITVAGAEAHGIRAASHAAAAITVAGDVQASGAYGIGVGAASAGASATLTLASSAVVAGGWQADARSVGANLNAPAAGVLIASATNSLIDNAGMIGAASDRAIADANRGSGTGGALSVQNTGTITGFLEYAEGPGNSFNNAASGILELRHFADTDGDGVRDTKRVAVSDFGATDSVFNNAGTVRLAAATEAAVVDAAGYVVPTTGADRRPLEASFYDLNRADVVQAQLVNLGTFNHSGVLDLRGPAIGNTLLLTGGATGSAVFVANGGTLQLNAVLNEGIAPGGASNSYADMLIVDSTRLGTAPTAIQVSYDATSSVGLTTGSGVQLVEVLDNTASAAGVFVLGNRVAAGAYEYQLHHNGLDADAADGNWYLRSTLIEAAPTPTPTPVPPPGPGTPEPAPEYPNYRPEIPTYVALPALAHRFGMEMLGSYHDRVGQDYIDLPVSNPALAVADGQPQALRRETSMWGRFYGFRGGFGDNKGSISSQYDKFQKRGASYDRHSLGLQLGLDLHRATGPKGSRLTAGLYGGIGEITGTADAVYGGRSGKARLTGYSLGGYWTHTGSKGSYLDFEVQGTRYEAKLKAVTDEGFNPDGWGVSASLEGGKPVVLGDGWVLEPQGQLIHQYLMFDDGEDRFARIHYKSSTATYGRLGARLARSWTASGERRMTAWGRFNVWHDFEQQATTRISTLSGQQVVDLNASLGGTWGQAQVALSGELTPRISAFASGDYNFSLDSANAEGFGWRVGMRARF